MTNLISLLSSRLPGDLTDFLKSAGAVADERGERLYLVGGVVRDLLLGRATFDVDITVEGDALATIQNLPQLQGVKATVHKRFGTAKVKWQKWSIDFTTARSETYERPGALPTVDSGSLKEDLFRRDFTVNAMAVHLSPARFGELVDLYSGMDDLEKKLIRVLHDRSFIDDATRIWRAIRYEQRLDFEIEPHTLELLKRDVPMLDTITADRLRYELECVLNEEEPEKALRRSDELGVLRKLHPALIADDWLVARFQSARLYFYDVRQDTYLALLACRLSAEQAESLISSLNMPKAQAQAVRDAVSLKDRLQSLGSRDTSPSQVYALLKDCCRPALEAHMVATDSQKVVDNIRLFMDRLGRIKTILTGDDLMNLGIPPGPKIGEALELLRYARMDGKVETREEEVDWVKTYSTLRN